MLINVFRKVAKAVRYRNLVSIRAFGANVEAAKETREKVKETSAKAGEEASSMYQKTKEKLSEVIEGVEEKASEMGSAAKRAYDSTKKAIEGVMVDEGTPPRPADKINQSPMAGQEGMNGKDLLGIRGKVEQVHNEMDTSTLEKKAISDRLMKEDQEKNQM